MGPPVRLTARRRARYSDGLSFAVFRSGKIHPRPHRARPATAIAAALAAAGPGTAARAAPTGQETVSGLSATDLFDMADRARAEGRADRAEALYRALAHDPDIEIRSEARFRLGMMLADEARYRDAAIAFRALLDEKPDAARVRLELARVLALTGDQRGARRQLRAAQAAGLPPDVAVTVNKFAAALRTTRPLGGSFEIALAPDSNINRATRATTLDTVFVPLTLDEDARAQSGVGLYLGGQAYARQAIGDRIGLLARVSAQANLYAKARFDDIAGALAAGPEITLARHRLRPALGISRRWYGGALYQKALTAQIEWLATAGPRTQIETALSASRARFPANALRDGAHYSASVAIERAFTPASGGSVTLSADRRTAADPGYATASGGISLLGWRELGRTTLYATIGYTRLEGDARLFLFPERRREDNVRVTIGASLRRFRVEGFAPLVRLTYERNASTVGLYDYSRKAIEIGLGRAF